MQNKLCALNLDLDTRDHKSGDVTLSVTNIVPKVDTRMGHLGVSSSANLTTFDVLQSVRGKNVANVLELRAERAVRKALIR